MCLGIARLMAFLIDGSDDEKENRKEKRWDEEKGGLTQSELYHLFVQSSDPPVVEISVSMTETGALDEKGEDADDELDHEEDEVVDEEIE